jgi:hypothetical protein
VYDTCLAMDPVFPKQKLTELLDAGCTVDTAAITEAAGAATSGGGSSLGRVGHSALALAVVPQGSTIATLLASAVLAV